MSNFIRINHFENMLGIKLIVINNWIKVRDQIVGELFLETFKMFIHTNYFHFSGLLIED
jgi:hypothetical protein